MAVPLPGGAGRSRLLVACALTAAVAAAGSYGPSASNASVTRPVDGVDHGAAVVRATSDIATSERATSEKATSARAKVRKVKIDPRLFGLHDSFFNSLDRKGTGAIRLWDAGVQWKDIFPTQDDGPEWARLDDIVTRAHENGTEVTLVLGLTPSYAGATPESMPNLEMYRTYVQAVMERYSPSNWPLGGGNHYRGIAAYQVWNEANIDTFWTGGYDGLGQLVKTVHDVRDAVDVGAKVVAPAMVARLGYQQKGIKAFFKTQVEGRPVYKYVDAISLNLYPLDRYPNPNPTRAGTPEDAIALLKTVRGILADDGVPRSKPIWNTEINYGLTFGTNAGQPATPIPVRRQIAYVIRTYLLNAARGVKRIDWYAYDLDARGSVGPLANTLLTDPVNRAAGTLLPPGRAFTRVQGWMKGTLIGTTTKAPCIKDRHGTYTCTVKYSSGMGRIYWNPYKSAKVTLVRSARKKIDEYGASSRAKGGTKLKVNDKPVLVKSTR
jgi:polysaccharide biosynthesis protein PslG